MGTSCVTIVFNELNEELVCMYRHFDGGPETHGKELHDFLLGKKITNGIETGMTLDTHFNGMDCLAAALVAHFKKGIGDFYLLSLENYKECESDYVYKVFCERGEIKVTTHDL